MNALDELKNVLDAEVAGHERLLELMIRERDQVVRGKPEELLATLEEIRDAADHIDSLEERRRSACREVGREYKISSENPTLTEIGAATPESETDCWTDLRNRFSGLLDQLARINQETQYLVRGSLSWVGEILGLLAGEPAAGSTYDAKGSGNGVGSSAVLVNKTI